MSQVHRAPPGLREKLFFASIGRSLHDGPLEQAPVGETVARYQLWWGPMVEVEKGQIVRFFRTPVGIMVESVEAAEPEPQPLGPGESRLTWNPPKVREQ